MEQSPSSHFSSTRAVKPRRFASRSSGLAQNAPDNHSVPAKRIVVRERAKSRELWIDGTFASLYRPGSPATGGVWDALAAPLLLLPPKRRRSVLLLGFGAGSAARLARALAPEAHIVGVDADPDVLAVAEREFALADLRLELVCAYARQFLLRTRRRFDFIMEDVFVGSGRALHKPDWLPEPGLQLAARRLRRGGILAVNAIDETAAVRRSLRALFPAVLQIHVKDYDNQILVGGPIQLSASALRVSIARHPALRQSAKCLHLHVSF